MSAFYDLASLVLVPSGYKASKVYAQKPLTTDGQLTFSRASTATRVNSAGLIETVSSNVPRLDYLGSTCPKLQLEPQRSNICTYSHQIDQWSQERTSTTANAIASPDGTTNADKVNADSTPDTSHQVYNGPFTNTAGNVTLSGFFKKGEYNWVHFGGGSANSKAWFNLNTGVVGSKQSDVVTTSMIDYGNGWYRCISVVNFSTTSNYVEFGPASVDNSRVITGTPSGGIYGWGIQFENAASYPTSLIPTTTAAVTRLADACSKTGISSLIGQTEGTIYAEVEKLSGTEFASWRFQLSDGTNANWIFFSLEDSDDLRIYVRKSGVTSVDIQPSNKFVNDGVYKIAMAYSNLDAVVYINGSLAVSSTGAVIPSTDNFIITGSNSSPAWSTQSKSGKVNQALLFKTRLTNAQLAELTTL